VSTLRYSILDGYVIPLPACAPITSILVDSLYSVSVCIHRRPFEPAEYSYLSLVPNLYFRAVVSPTALS